MVLVSTIQWGASAKALYRRNMDFVRLKSTMLSILPLSAKIVDTVFGKLPGALAEYSTKLAETALKEERRIVVYQTGAFSKELLQIRIKQLEQYK